MRLTAPAKINPYLAVLGRRPDGLHDLESVMQSISLVDENPLQPAEVVSLDVIPPGAAPEDESNLVVRAVRALVAAAGRSGGASIALTKQIPSGAGLGGGSSDAAATLIGLNELWRSGISRKALEKIGAGLGADVPFCVRGGACVVRGAGEALAPLVLRSELWWVIAMPPEPLSTAEVYARFDSLGSPVRKAILPLWRMRWPAVTSSVWALRCGTISSPPRSRCSRRSVPSVTPYSAQARSAR